MTHLLDTSAILAHYLDESGANEVDPVPNATRLTCCTAMVGLYPIPYDWDIRMIGGSAPKNPIK